jgi:hypothetical protein
LKVEGFGRGGGHGVGVRSECGCKNGKTIVADQLRKVKIAGLVGR